MVSRNLQILILMAIEAILQKVLPLDLWFITLAVAILWVLWRLDVLPHRSEGRLHIQETPTSDDAAMAALIVEPGEFALHEGNLSNTTNLLVRNTGNRTRYSVWVKVWTDTVGMKAEHMMAEPRDASPLLEIPGPISVDDVIVLWWVDRDNCESVCIRFHELAPSASRRIVIKGSPVPGLRSSRAYASVIRSSSSPDKVLTVTPPTAIVEEVLVGEVSMLPPMAGRMKNIKVFGKLRPWGQGYQSNTR